MGRVSNGLLNYEERVRAPLFPLSAWPVGERMPALALMSWSNDLVLMQKMGSLSGCPFLFDLDVAIAVAYDY